MINLSIRRGNTLRADVRLSRVQNRSGWMYYGARHTGWVRGDTRITGAEMVLSRRNRRKRKEKAACSAVGRNYLLLYSDSIKYRVGIHIHHWMGGCSAGPEVRLVRLGYGLEMGGEEFAMVVYHSLRLRTETVLHRH